MNVVLQCVGGRWWVNLIEDDGTVRILGWNYASKGEAIEYLESLI